MFFSFSLTWDAVGTKKIKESNHTWVELFKPVYINIVIDFWSFWEYIFFFFFCWYGNEKSKRLQIAFKTCQTSSGFSPINMVHPKSQFSLYIFFLIFSFSGLGFLTVKFTTVLYEETKNLNYLENGTSYNKTDRNFGLRAIDITAYSSHSHLGVILCILNNNMFYYYYFLLKGHNCHND